MEYLISKGSKNAIAKEIVDFLPKAETFVDVCAGGCAVSHAAMLSGKYNKIVINDVNPMPTQLFIDAMNGRYKNERRWISREDFNRLKDTDAYVKYCWSFGNNGKDYLYGADVEEFKHGLHFAIFESDTGLLEKALNLPNRTIPHFDGVTDISKRYALYRKYLQSVVGGGQRLQSLEALKGLDHNPTNQQQD